MKPIFTIVAFPRSGTRYVATLLYNNGILCKHEYLHPHNEHLVPPLTHNTVSWLPFQWRQFWVKERTRIIHLVRDPYDVVKSWPTFLKRNREYIYTLTNTENFRDAWMSWNRTIERWTDVRFKVEDVEDQWDDFVEALGYPKYPLHKIPSGPIHSYKSKDGYGTLTIDTNLAFRAMRSRYGY